MRLIGPGRDERHWEHFSEALDVLVRQCQYSDSSLQALIDETRAESSHRPAALGKMICSRVAVPATKEGESDLVRIKINGLIVGERC